MSTAYFPTLGQDEEFLEVLSLLDNDIATYHTENTVIILGTDSNVSSKSTNRRSEALQKFLKTFSLCSVLTSEAPTFHHNNQSSESQIDHIYYYIPAKSSLRLEFKDQLCLKDEPMNISSHDVIVGEAVFPIVDDTFDEKDESSSYTQFVVEKPKWNESGKEGYETETARVLQGLIEKYNEIEHIPVLCEMFAKTLVMSIENNFETTTPKLQPKKTFSYFSRE